MYENRPVKLACKGLISYIYMVRSAHEQKESLVEAILRMRALNSYTICKKDKRGRSTFRKGKRHGSIDT